MNARTIVSCTATAFALWWMISQPLSAEHLVRNTGSVLTAVANGVSRFLASI